MTEPTIDKIAVRIAKLLAQAEDAARGGRPLEEQTFQVKAFEMMAKYGVDERTARAAREGMDTKIEAQAEYIYQTMEGKYKPVQATFFYHFAEAMHCKSILVGGRRGNVTVQVFGMPEHLRRVQLMWSLLQPQLLRGMKTAEPPFGYSHSGELRTYRRNWVLGYQNAVVERVRNAETALAAKTEGVVALYKNDLVKAEEAYTAMWPKTQTFQSRVRSNPHAYGSGYRAGEAAILQHQVGE